MASATPGDLVAYRRAWPQAAAHCSGPLLWPAASPPPCCAHLLGPGPHGMAGEEGAARQGGHARVAEAQAGMRRGSLAAGGRCLHMPCNRHRLLSDRAALGRRGAVECR